MEQALIVSVALLWGVALANFLFALVLTHRLGGEARPLSSSGKSLADGRPAPGFTAVTLQGERVSLANYADCTAAFISRDPGCGPCREVFANH